MKDDAKQRVSEFVLAALRSLVEIPRPWHDREDVDLPPLVIELSEAEERYEALCDDDRARLYDLWGKFQALMERQREVQAEAAQLGQEFTRKIPSHISPAADELLKTLTLQDELANVSGELSLMPLAVVLEVARALEQKQKHGPT